jgi:hypothetical protein
VLLPAHFSAPAPHAGSAERTYFVPMKRLFATTLAWTVLATSGFGQNPPVPAEASGAQEIKWNRGAAFLTRLRYADPDYRLILIACLKENELNLLLSRFVTNEELPILVKGLLTQLSQQFPGENLSVVAYRPVVPLREAALARLDSRTGQVSYLTNPNPGVNR